jgi:hypothetical protein
MKFFVHVVTLKLTSFPYRKRYLYGDCFDFLTYNVTVTLCHSWQCYLGIRRNHVYFIGPTSQLIYIFFFKINF